MMKLVAAILLLYHGNANGQNVSFQPESQSNVSSGQALETSRFNNLNQSTTNTGLVFNSTSFTDTTRNVQSQVPSSSASSVFNVSASSASDGTKSRSLQSAMSSDASASSASALASSRSLQSAMSSNASVSSVSSASALASSRSLQSAVSSNASVSSVSSASALASSRSLQSAMSSNASVSSASALASSRSLQSARSSNASVSSVSALASSRSLQSAMNSNASVSSVSALASSRSVRSAMSSNASVSSVSALVSSRSLQSVMSSNASVSSASALGSARSARSALSSNASASSASALASPGSLQSVMSSNASVSPASALASPRSARSALSSNASASSASVSASPGTLQSVMSSNASVSSVSASASTRSLQPAMNSNASASSASALASPGSFQSAMRSNASVSSASALASPGSLQSAKGSNASVSSASALASPGSLQSAMRSNSSVSTSSASALTSPGTLQSVNASVSPASALASPRSARSSLSSNASESSASALASPGTLQSAMRSNASVSSASALASPGSLQSTMRSNVSASSASALASPGSLQSTMRSNVSASSASALASPGSLQSTMRSNASASSASTLASPGSLQSVMSSNASASSASALASPGSFQSAMRSNVSASSASALASPGSLQSTMRSNVSASSASALASPRSARSALSSNASASSASVLASPGTLQSVMSSNAPVSSASALASSRSFQSAMRSNASVSSASALASPGSLQSTMRSNVSASSASALASPGSLQSTMRSNTSASSASALASPGSLQSAKGSNVSASSASVLASPGTLQSAMRSNASVSPASALASPGSLQSAKGSSASVSSASALASPGSLQSTMRSNVSASSASALASPGTLQSVMSSNASSVSASASASSNILRPTLSFNTSMASVPAALSSRSLGSVHNVSASRVFEHSSDFNTSLLITSGAGLSSISRTVSISVRPSLNSSVSDQITSVSNNESLAHSATVSAGSSIKVQNSESMNRSFMLSSLAGSTVKTRTPVSNLILSNATVSSSTENFSALHSSSLRNDTAESRNSAPMGFTRTANTSSARGEPTSASQQKSYASTSYVPTFRASTGQSELPVNVSRNNSSPPFASEPNTRMDGTKNSSSFETSTASVKATNISIPISSTGNVTTPSTAALSNMTSRFSRPRAVSSNASSTEKVTQSSVASGLLNATSKVMTSKSSIATAVAENNSVATSLTSPSGLVSPLSNITSLLTNGQTSKFSGNSSRSGNSWSSFALNTSATAPGHASSNKIGNTSTTDGPSATRHLSFPHTNESLGSLSSSKLPKSSGTSLSTAFTSSANPSENSSRVSTSLSIGSAKVTGATGDAVSRFTHILPNESAVGQNSGDMHTRTSNATSILSRSNAVQSAALSSTAMWNASSVNNSVNSGSDYSHTTVNSNSATNNTSPLVFSSPVSLSNHAESSNSGIRSRLPSNVSSSPYTSVESGLGTQTRGYNTTTNYLSSRLSQFSRVRSSMNQTSISNMKETSSVVEGSSVPTNRSVVSTDASNQTADATNSSSSQITGIRTSASVSSNNNNTFPANSQTITKQPQSATINNRSDTSPVISKGASSGSSNAFNNQSSSVSDGGSPSLVTGSFNASIRSSLVSTINGTSLLASTGGTSTNLSVSESIQASGKERSSNMLRTSTENNSQPLQSTNTLLSSTSRVSFAAPSSRTSFSAQDNYTSQSNSVGVQSGYPMISNSSTMSDSSMTTSNRTRGDSIITGKYTRSAPVGISVSGPSSGDIKNSITAFPASSSQNITAGVRGSASETAASHKTDNGNASISSQLSVRSQMTSSLIGSNSAAISKNASAAMTTVDSHNVSAPGASSTEEGSTDVAQGAKNTSGPLPVNGTDAGSSSTSVSGTNGKATYTTTVTVPCTRTTCRATPSITEYTTICTFTWKEPVGSECATVSELSSTVVISDNSKLITVPATVPCSVPTSQTYNQTGTTAQASENPTSTGLPHSEPGGSSRTQMTISNADASHNGSLTSDGAGHISTVSPSGSLNQPLSRSQQTRSNQGLQDTSLSAPSTPITTVTTTVVIPCSKESCQNGPTTTVYTTVCTFTFPAPTGSECRTASESTSTVVISENSRVVSVTATVPCSVTAGGSGTSTEQTATQMQPRPSMTTLPSDHLTSAESNNTAGIGSASIISRNGKPQSTVTTTVEIPCSKESCQNGPTTTVYTTVCTFTFPAPTGSECRTASESTSTVVISENSRVVSVTATVPCSVTAEGSSNSAGVPLNEQTPTQMQTRPSRTALSSDQLTSAESNNTAGIESASIISRNGIPQSTVTTTVEIPCSKETCQNGPTTTVYTTICTFTFPAPTGSECRTASESTSTVVISENSRVVSVTATVPCSVSGGSNINTIISPTSLELSSFANAPGASAQATGLSRTLTPAANTYETSPYSDRLLPTSGFESRYPNTTVVGINSETSESESRLNTSIESVGPSTVTACEALSTDINGSILTKSVPCGTVSSENLESEANTRQSGSRNLTSPMVKSTSLITTSLANLQSQVGNSSQLVSGARSGSSISSILNASPSSTISSSGVVSSANHNGTTVGMPGSGPGNFNNGSGISESSIIRPTSYSSVTSQASSAAYLSNTSDNAGVNLGHTLNVTSGLIPSAAPTSTDNTATSETTPYNNNTNGSLQSQSTSTIKLMSGSSITTGALVGTPSISNSKSPSISNSKSPSGNNSETTITTTVTIPCTQETCRNAESATTYTTTCLFTVPKVTDSECSTTSHLYSVVNISENLKSITVPITIPCAASASSNGFKENQTSGASSGFTQTTTSNGNTTFPSAASVDTPSFAVVTIPCQHTEVCSRSGYELSTIYPVQPNNSETPSCVSQTVLTTISGSATMTVTTSVACGPISNNATSTNTLYSTPLGGTTAQEQTTSEFSSESPGATVASAQRNDSIPTLTSGSAEQSFATGVNSFYPSVRENNTASSAASESFTVITIPCQHTEICSRSGYELSTIYPAATAVGSSTPCIVSTVITAISDSKTVTISTSVACRNSGLPGSEIVNASTVAGSTVETSGSIVSGSRGLLSTPIMQQSFTQSPESTETSKSQITVGSNATTRATLSNSTGAQPSISRGQNVTSSTPLSAASSEATMQVPSGQNVNSSTSPAASSEATTPVPPGANATSSTSPAASNEATMPVPSGQNVGSSTSPAASSEATTPVPSGQNVTTPSSAASGEATMPVPSGQNVTTPPSAASREATMPVPLGANVTSLTSPAASSGATMPVHPGANVSSPIPSTAESSEANTSVPPGQNFTSSAPTSAASNEAGMPVPPGGKLTTTVSIPCTHSTCVDTVYTTVCTISVPPTTSPQQCVSSSIIYSTVRVSGEFTVLSVPASVPCNTMPASSSENLTTSPSAASNAATMPVPPGANVSSSTSPAASSEATIPAPPGANVSSSTSPAASSEATMPVPSGQNLTTPPSAASSEATMPVPSGQNVSSSTSPAASSEATTPVPSGQNVTTPSSAASSEATMPAPPGANVSSSIPSSAESRESTPPVPSGQNVSSSIPSSAESRESTPPVPSGQNVSSSIPSSAESSESTMPVPPGANVTSSTSPAASNEATMPVSPGQNLISSTSPAASSETTTPVPSGQSVTIPSSAASGEATMPVPSGQNVTTPPSAASSEATTPVPSGQNVTTPSSAASNEATMPVPPGGKLTTTVSIPCTHSTCVETVYTTVCTISVPPTTSPQQCVSSSIIYSTVRVSGEFTVLSVPASVPCSSMPASSSENLTTSPSAASNAATMPVPPGANVTSSTSPSAASSEATMPVPSGQNLTSSTMAVPPGENVSSSISPSAVSSEATIPVSSGANVSSSTSPAASSEATTPVPSGQNLTTPPSAASSEAITPVPSGQNVTPTAPPSAASSEATIPLPSGANVSSSTSPAASSETTTPVPSGQNVTTPSSAASSKATMPAPSGANVSSSVPPSAESSEATMPVPPGANVSSSTSPAASSETTTPVPSGQNLTTSPSAASSEAITPVPPGANVSSSIPPSAESSEATMPVPPGANVTSSTSPAASNEATMPVPPDQNLISSTPSSAASNEAGMTVPPGGKLTTTVSIPCTHSTCVETVYTTVCTISVPPTTSPQQCVSSSIIYSTVRVSGEFTVLSVPASVPCSSMPVASSENGPTSLPGSLNSEATSVKPSETGNGGVSVQTQTSTGQCMTTTILTTEEVISSLTRLVTTTLATPCGSSVLPSSAIAETMIGPTTLGTEIVHSSLQSATSRIPGSSPSESDQGGSGSTSIGPGQSVSENSIGSMVTTPCTDTSCQASGFTSPIISGSGMETQAAPVSSLRSSITSSEIPELSKSSNIATDILTSPPATGFSTATQASSAATSEISSSPLGSILESQSLGTISSNFAGTIISTMVTVPCTHTSCRASAYTTSVSMNIPTPTSSGQCMTSTVFGCDIVVSSATQSLITTISLPCGSTVNLLSSTASLKGSSEGIQEATGPGNSLLPRPTVTSTPGSMYLASETTSSTNNETPAKSEITTSAESGSINNPNTPVYSTSDSTLTPMAGTTLASSETETSGSNTFSSSNSGIITTAVTAASPVASSSMRGRGPSKAQTGESLVNSILSSAPTEQPQGSKPIPSGTYQNIESSIPAAVSGTASAEIPKSSGTLANSGSSMVSLGSVISTMVTVPCTHDSCQNSEFTTPVTMTVPTATATGQCMTFTIFTSDIVVSSATKSLQVSINLPCGSSVVNPTRSTAGTEVTNSMTDLSSGASSTPSAGKTSVGGNSISPSSGASGSSPTSVETPLPISTTLSPGQTMKTTISAPCTESTCTQTMYTTICSLTVPAATETNQCITESTLLSTIYLGSKTTVLTVPVSIPCGSMIQSSYSTQELTSSPRLSSLRSLNTNSGAASRPELSASASTPQSTETTSSPTSATIQPVSGSTIASSPSMPPTKSEESSASAPGNEKSSTVNNASQPATSNGLRSTALFTISCTETSCVGSELTAPVTMDIPTATSSGQCMTSTVVTTEVNISSVPKTLTTMVSLPCGSTLNLISQQSSDTPSRTAVKSYGTSSKSLIPSSSESASSPIYTSENSIISSVPSVSAISSEHSSAQSASGSTTSNLAIVTRNSAESQSGIVITVSTLSPTTTCPTSLLTYMIQHGTSTLLEAPAATTADHTLVDTSGSLANRESSNSPPPVMATSVNSMQPELISGSPELATATGKIRSTQSSLQFANAAKRTSVSISSISLICLINVVFIGVNLIL